ncbi:MAG: S8 family serine peptidase, partial [Planctomycetota bacterium]
MDSVQAHAGVFDRVPNYETTTTETIFWDGQTVEVVSGQWIVHVVREPESDGAFSTNPFSGDEFDASETLAQSLLTRREPVQRIAETSTNEQWLYQFEDSLIAAAMLDAFSRVPSVRVVEPNFAVSIDLTPNDTSFSELWGFDNANDIDIDAPEAWDLTTGSGSVVIGVIDTGVDYNHPDLRDNIWVNPIECPAGIGACVEDGIDNDNNGYVDDIYGWDFYNNDNDPFDDNSHGTHVAGTIAAVGNNSRGVVGVNWDAKIMALKFLGAAGRGSTSGAVAAIEYVNQMKRDYGVDIRLTNNSWGGGGYSQSLYDAIEESQNQDLLFVAAAGNDSSDNDVEPHYPSSYDLDNVVAVASITSTGSVSSFSNTGANSVDLAAPGSSILSTEPDGQYGYKSGTSMATPHVAGVAALAWSTNENASYRDVRDAVLGGVVPLASLNGQTVTGGIVNAEAAVQRMGFFATAVTPVEFALLEVAPTEFTIDFSGEFDAASIDATDLVVNSMPADSFTVVDSDTVRFEFSSSPVTEEGEQSLLLAAGSVTETVTGEVVAALDTLFFFDPTPLRVASTSPPSGGLLSLPTPEITIDFTEPYAPGSISHQDFVVSDGRVDGLTFVDSDTVRIRLADFVSETSVSLSIAPGAITDLDGFPIEGFSQTHPTDSSSLDLTDRFSDIGAPGSLVREVIVSGLFHAPGDRDEYSIEMLAGQVAGLVVTPRAAQVGNDLQVDVQVLSPTGTVVTSATGTLGQPTSIPSFEAMTPGEYRVEIENVSSVSGDYEVMIVAGSAVETGDFGTTGVGGNDSLSDAEPLADAWATTGGHTHLTVTGSLDQNLSPDWYQLDIPSDSSASFVLQISEEAAATLSIHLADGSTITDGVVEGETLRIDHVAFPDGQTLFARVDGIGPVAYTLSVSLNASFETDRSSGDLNGSIDDAQELPPSNRIVGQVGSRTLSAPGVGVTQSIGVVSTISLNSTPEGDQVRDIVYTPDGLHYLIAHPYSGNVIVYDAATGDVVADLPTGRSVDLEVTPDGAYALSANRDSGTVSVIDLSSFTKVTDIALSATSPYRVHVTPDSSTAVVASADDRFMVVSLATLQETLSIDIAGHGLISSRSAFESERVSVYYSDFVISGDGTKFVVPVGDHSTGAVQIIDLVTGDLSTSIPMPRRPILAMNVAGTRVYAATRDASNDNTISEIDLTTETKVRDITGPPLFGDGMLLTHDEQYLVVSTLNAITFLDVTDGSISNSIQQGSADAFALTFDGQHVLGRQLIDVSTQTQVGNLPVFPWLDLVVTSPTELRGIQATSYDNEDYAILQLAGAAPTVQATRSAGAADEGDT